MVEQLRLRRDELMRRLDSGDDAIWQREEGTGKPAPKAWVDTWLMLLAEYERTCDTLRAKEGR
jgi:hypothetical protein